MKKIIYSLVIMIAAGSLFTSCIEQVEPLGIQDMRFAKAEYIRALKDLRAADAEYVRAQAAFELARARYKDAQTANLNADTEYKKLLNEYQQLINEARQDTNDFISQETANRIDSIKKRMELREKQHAKDMVAAEDSLVNAQERLRVALRNIALSAQSLTEKEKNALENATKAYEIAFEKVANQTVAVFKAQQRVDSAMIMLARADQEVDSDSSFVDARPYYQRKLEEAQLSAGVSGALLLLVGMDLDDLADSSNIILPEDLSEWSTKIEEYKDANATIDYNKHELTEEIAGYYVTYIHDGWKAYNDAINAVAAKYSTTPKTYNGQLTPTEINKLKAGEPEEWWYMNGYADTISYMPTLKTKDSPTFKKFKSMIDPYFSAFKNNAPDSTGNYKVKKNGEDVVMMKEEAGKWTLYVNQYWKEFLLGSDEGTVASQNFIDWNDDDVITVDITSDYGLKGAVSVLERKMVTKEAELKNYVDSVEKYQGIWEADRDTLAKVYKKWNTTDLSEYGLGKDSVYMKEYKPFADALAAYHDAQNATKQAVTDSAEVAGKMITAMNDFIAKYNDHINGGTWSTADSAQMLAAAVEFAKAREAYFTAANGLKTDTLDFIKKNEHPNYLHYLASSDPVVIDSIEFNKLDMTKLRETVTMKYHGGSNKTNCKYGWQYDTGNSWADTADVFVRIFTQMLNADIAADLTAGNLFTDTAKFNNDNYRAFYQQFKYVKADGNFKIVKGDKAMPAKADEQRATEASKKEALKKAVNGYKAVYERYWGINTVPTTKANVKNPECYVDTTFTDPFCIANFKDADTLVWTPGLGAVLASVDPSATSDAKGENFKGTKGEVKNSYIFGTDKKSDFWNYMYWLEMIDEIDSQDLATIKEWIEGIELAFEFDAEQATVVDEEEYEKGKKAYAKLVAKKAALVEFTGADTDGNPKGFTRADDYSTLPSFYTESAPAYFAFNLAGYSGLYDIWTGKWAVKGTQAENAEKFFPGLTAKLVEWQAAIAKEADQKTHNTTMQTALEKAYVTAAKAKYDLQNITPATDDMKDVIAAYQSKVLADLSEVIDAYQKAVGTETVEGDIQKYTKKIRDYEVDVILGKVHPAQFALEDAKADLAIETARLQGYQDVLAYAKANLDKILEYIKSLDVNFVVVTDDDIKNNK